MPIINETVHTTARSQMVDITDRISKLVQQRGVEDGFVIVYVPHTTAACTIQENADPDVQHDLAGQAGKTHSADGDVLPALMKATAMPIRKTAMIGNSVHGADRSRQADAGPLAGDLSGGAGWAQGTARDGEDCGSGDGIRTVPAASAMTTFDDDIWKSLSIGKPRESPSRIARYVLVAFIFTFIAFARSGAADHVPADAGSFSAHGRHSCASSELRNLPAVRRRGLDAVLRSLRQKS